MRKYHRCAHATKDVFIIPDGAPGALAELERRKFTAEEGASAPFSSSYQRVLMTHAHLIRTISPCSMVSPSFSNVLVCIDS